MLELETAFGLIAGVLVVSALAAGLVERAPLSFPMLFLGLGFLLGDRGLQVISIGLDSSVLEVVAVVALALVLFLDAVNLELTELRRDWLVPVLVLGPATLLVIGLLAGLGTLLLDLPVVLALLLGTILASTDPVVLRDVLRDRRIPRSVRRTLERGSWHQRHRGPADPAGPDRRRSRRPWRCERLAGLCGPAVRPRPGGRLRRRRGRVLGHGPGRPALPDPPRIPVAVRHRPGPRVLCGRPGRRRGRLPGRLRRRAGGDRGQPDAVRLFPGLRPGHRRDDHAAGLRAVRRPAVDPGRRRCCCFRPSCWPCWRSL